MSEELYNSNDYCKLAEELEESKKENAELARDKDRLMNLFMESSEYVFNVVSYMKINDLGQKCKRLEADYEISNRELLVKQVEITALRAEIERLHAAQRWIPVEWDALKVALFWMNVEKTEYCWIWTGSKNSCGYGTLHGARAHQISYKMFHGDLPEGLEIMHTCNNPACVNPGHLLAGTHQENMQSMFKLRRYSRCGKSSKYIGVSFRSDSHKWRAVLNKKSLGNYESEDDAAKAYDKAALVHYGKDAALNFPLPQPLEVQE